MMFIAHYSWLGLAVDNKCRLYEALEYGFYLVHIRSNRRGHTFAETICFLEKGTRISSVCDDNRRIQCIAAVAMFTESKLTFSIDGLLIYSRLEDILLVCRLK